MVRTVSFDPGYGSVKLYGPQGGLVFQSVVSVGGGKTVRRMTGLRVSRPPLRVELNSGAFYVGEGAHDWGRPVENLDFDRLTGSPEMQALFYGALSKYGTDPSPFDLIVGLPIASLAGESTTQAVVEFLKGTHEWTADEMPCSAMVRSVRITSQPVGAMFDYLLNDDGEMPMDRRSAFKGEIGVLGIGMNTVELLVVRGGTPVQRFTGGEPLGVRRLLELVNRDGLYSLGELDSKLRGGSLDVQGVLPIWQSELLGFVEKHWGESFKRFDRIVVVGGGVMLTRNGLLARFKDKAHIPDDPVISTARGMYKYLLMRSRRGK